MKTIRNVTYASDFLIGCHKVIVGDIDEVESRTDGDGSLVEASDPTWLQLTDDLSILTEFNIKPTNKLDPKINDWIDEKTKLWNLFLKDETTAPSTVAASWNAIGPERHVIAEGYRLVMWLGSWNFCLMTTLTLILTLRPSRCLPWPYSRTPRRFWKLLCARMLWLCTELFLHRRRCSSHFVF